jgi:photosystem II stability/assembly factor-like uncharacterized protein
MRRRLALALCSALVAAPVARAAELQSVDPSLFSGLHWRGIGPFRGGRALAVAGVSGEPGVFYFGAAAGGVWKTQDSGARWKPVFDSQPISSIGAIAVAPSNHNIVYVGTGEGALRGNITFGDGIYKSEDAGKSWKNIGLHDTRQIGALIVDPKNPDIVLVAALGHAFGSNEARGIFRSINGGKTWTKTLYKDKDTGAIPTSSLLRFGKCAASPGISPAVAPAAACIVPRMAGRRGNSSKATACPAAFSGASTWRLRRLIPSAFMP